MGKPMMRQENSTNIKNQKEETKVDGKQEYKDNSWWNNLFYFLTLINSLKY